MTGLRNTGNPPRTEPECICVERGPGGMLLAFEPRDDCAACVVPGVLDELALHLAWASRVKPDSPSRKHLRKMFERPEVLDLFERLVNAERDV